MTKFRKTPLSSYQISLVNFYKFIYKKKTEYMLALCLASMTHVGIPLFGVDSRLVVAWWVLGVLRCWSCFVIFVTNSVVVIIWVDVFFYYLWHVSCGIWVYVPDVSGAYECIVSICVVLCNSKKTVDHVLVSSLLGSLVAVPKLYGLVAHFS